MKNLPDLLKETLDLVRSHSQFLTLSELTKEVSAVEKSLRAFLAKSEESKDFLNRDYIEIHALLQEKRTSSPTLTKEVGKSGLTFTGKEKNKKLALFAIRKGIEEKVLSELRASPDDILRLQFRALAQKPENEIEEALKTLLKGKQLEKFAQAMDFAVVRRRTSKGDSIDRKTTLANARAKLKPFIDSIRDAR
jgi:hypothetical protein